MTFEQAQYIIIGMEDGWLVGTQKDYEEAKKYVRCKNKVEHLGLREAVAACNEICDNADHICHQCPFGQKADCMVDNMCYCVDDIERIVIRYRRGEDVFDGL